MLFRYLRDPLFLFCLILYFVNRLILKPLVRTGLAGQFIHGSLNDLICIPFWVPIMVWILHVLRLRHTDSPPTAPEVLVPLLVWSWWFKIMLPQTAAFRHWVVPDPGDVLTFTSGALIAVLYWQWHYRTR
jgi:hypothetical protein